MEELEQELAEARAALAKRESPPPPKRSQAPGSVVVVLGVVALAAAGVVARAGVGNPVVLIMLSTALWIGVLAVVVWRCIVIVGPTELAVLSGRPRKMADGSTVGYRLMRGGRMLRIPILESVDFMDLRARVEPIAPTGCYCKNGRVDVQAIATIRVDGAEPRSRNAVERFLGRSSEEIGEVARQTLEGTARAVVATLSVEELQENLYEVAERIRHQAEEDMDTLGMVIDGFKVLKIEPRD